MNKITIKDLYLIFARTGLFKVHIITEEDGKWIAIGDYETLDELYESERHLLYMDDKEDELMLNKRVLWFDITGQMMLIRVE